MGKTKRAKEKKIQRWWEEEEGEREMAHYYTNGEVEKRVYIVSAINLAVFLGIFLGELPVIWTMITNSAWNDVVSLHGLYSLVFSKSFVPSLCGFLLTISTYMIAIVAYKVFFQSPYPDPLVLTARNTDLVKALQRSFLLTCYAVLLRSVFLFTTPAFLLMVLIVAGWAACSDSEAARMLKF